jgi:periplasmic copper chaperone A
MIGRISAVLGAGFSVASASSLANAHIGITGPGFADTNQVITFSVGHGCEGSDTRSVRVEIPSEVLSVRAVDSNLGRASVELDDAGLVSSVTWEKPESDVLPSDTNYYTLALRLRVPNQPFTTLYFPAYQTCQTADGELIEVAWSAAASEDEAPEAEEPAPALTILPARVTGWNKLTVPVDVEDLSVFFSDAQIVWKGEAAYSSNAATTELIGSTEGVSELTSLEEGDEIWVKY